MASVNKVIIFGNVARDLDVRQIGQGKITTAIVATSRKYKNSAGMSEEETEWNRVVFFGKVAEFAEEKVKKGDRIHVMGHLRTKKYTDKHGIDRYQTEVICDELTL